MRKAVNITSFMVWILLLTASIYGYSNVLYKKDQTQKQENLASATDLEYAYFAGGCFWCVESGFEKYKQDWVIDAISGYGWGTTPNPTYRQVGGGGTGHREAVEVIYDPALISYEELLQIFWRLINPTDDQGQYVDRGFNYSSAIYYQNEEEKLLAEASKLLLQESGRYGSKELITPIIPHTTFYDAEEYHQDFYIKNPIRYNGYTNNSGRKEYLEGIWWEDVYYKLEK